MSRRHTKPLTNNRLRGLLREWSKTGNPVTKSDGDGLTFTVSKNGYAAWILRYGRAGRRRELTIGPYPDITLETARKHARVHRARISQGVDVAEEKKRELREARDGLTVRQLADDYIEVNLSAKRPSTAKLYGRYIRKWVVPKLGSIHAAKVTPSDIVAMLEAAKDHGAGALRTLHAATRNIFKHAQGKRKIDVNPAVGIALDSIIARPPRRKGIALQGEHLGTFLKALPDNPSGWAFRLHLITGVRPSEVLEASWKEFSLGSDKALWSLPEERTKTGQAFKIRLPRQAVEILRKLKFTTGASQYLFPAAYGDRDRPIPYQTYRGRLRALLASLGDNFPRIKAHDLRRTMRTGLSKLKVRYEVAERAINHKLPSMAEIYERNEYEDERYNALALWADHLDQLESANRGSKTRVPKLSR